MADIVKIDIHAAGIRALRMDPAMVEHVDGLAAAVAADLGDGYEARTSPKSTTRARAYVQPTTTETRIETTRNPARMVEAVTRNRG